MICDLGLLSVLILAGRGPPDQSDHHSKPEISVNTMNCVCAEASSFEISWALGVYEPILQSVIFRRLRSTAAAQDMASALPARVPRL